MDRLLGIATSVSDLNDITGIPIPMITYTDLKHINKLSELVNPASPCIYILIDFNRDNGIAGHWTLLSLFDEVDKKTGEIVYSLSYFDSYGKPVDGEMNHVPKDYIRKYYKSKTVLTQLVKKSAKEELKIKYIDYNSHKYQQEFTSVCGRYCAYFIVCAVRHGDSSDVFDTETFYKIMQSDMIKYKEANNIPMNESVEWDNLIVWLTA